MFDYGKCRKDTTVAGTGRVILSKFAYFYFIWKRRFTESGTESVCMS